MVDSNHSLQLIGLLQTALDQPVARSRLLQQPEKLRAIMNDIPTRHWLFERICQSDDSDRARTLLIAMMKASRLLRHGGKISPDVYSEALSRTWEWFIKHLAAYKPEVASFVTWFNTILGWKIQDVLQERANELKTRLHTSIHEDDDERFYPPAPQPDRWHETVQEWLELVQNDPHHLKNCHMRQSPRINCQVLLIQIIKRLDDSSDFSWELIAQDYGVEAVKLRRFCRGHCFNLFKKLLSD